MKKSENLGKIGSGIAILEKKTPQIFAIIPELGQHDLHSNIERRELAQLVAVGRPTKRRKVLLTERGEDSEHFPDWLDSVKFDQLANHILGGHRSRSSDITPWLMPGVQALQGLKNGLKRS